MMPWVLVAGDVTPLGGMDAANHALARHLAQCGTELHLVTHRVSADLQALPSVVTHNVWRPMGRHALGNPFLARSGRRVWQRLRARGAHAVVNGGNCRVPAVNWVHYLHAAHAPVVASTREGGIAFGHRRWLKTWLVHHQDMAAERRALQDARLVICNSRRTARDVSDRVGVDPERVRVVYYGTDASRFGQVSEGERELARRVLGLGQTRPLVGFVGALGDRRKGFDTVFAAWARLCRRSGWDADLVVIGRGAELDQWRARAQANGLARRMAFLGFRRDVPALLAGLDAMVHPARYEPYGLSVHEALCRGIPALVSASAGVAERYPRELSDLLIQNPEDVEELVERLMDWRVNAAHYQVRVARLASMLRSRSWDAMSRDIVTLVEQVELAA